jgi:hypothetical protein
MKLSYRKYSVQPIADSVETAAFRDSRIGHGRRKLADGSPAAARPNPVVRRADSDARKRSFAQATSALTIGGKQNGGFRVHADKRHLFNVDLS